jgi:hypothetical protein
MRSFEALDVALAMVNNPVLARTARRAPLPSGMLLLLEIAAGDAGALALAGDHSERSDRALREAAGFFIEQVMLDARADKYRILGATPDIATADLRRHMALLMRWLHPDVARHEEAGSPIDRSVFADIVTEAWEVLKSDDRRASYGGARMNGDLPAFQTAWPAVPVTAQGSRGPVAVGEPVSRRHKTGRRLVVRRLDRPSLWSRFVAVFWRR